MTIDDQLLDLEGYRLTIAHDIVALQSALQKVHPRYNPAAIDLASAEEARVLLLTSSELMHELNSISTTLSPLHDLFEYEHGS